MCIFFENTQFIHRGTRQWPSVAVIGVEAFITAPRKAMRRDIHSQLESESESELHLLHIIVHDYKRKNIRLGSSTAISHNH